MFIWTWILNDKKILAQPTSIQNGVLMGFNSLRPQKVTTTCD